MRPRPTRPLLAGALFASALLAGTLALLAACTGGDPESPGPATTPTPTATPALVFNEDGATGSFACDGPYATVNAADADLELTGDCGTVVVNGDRSQVSVDSAEIIVVNGVDAHVTYGGEPEVHLNGEGATAEPR